MFITALTSVRHISLSWANPIQSIYPHYTSWRSILILSTHLRLGVPTGLFPHQDPIHPLSSPIRATCPAHLILLGFITRTILGEEYKSFSSSLRSLLHSPVTSSLLGPNILLNTMFSNALRFLSSLIRDDICAFVSVLLKFVHKISKKIEIPNFIKILLVGKELFRAEGQTDTTKLTVSFTNFWERA